MLPFQLRSTFPCGSQGPEPGQAALLPASECTNQFTLTAHLWDTRAWLGLNVQHRKRSQDLHNAGHWVREALKPVRNELES